jgi:ubiquinone/menaquinone biosynthesis C-methylase UbiE
MTYNPEAIRNTYDEIAEREDRFEKGFSLRNDIPREFIKRHLKACDVVLDAGGGSGINAIMMAQRCKKVTLLDISPRMLKLAATNIQKAGLNERIHLVEGDITNLEQFGDAEFSFVVCVGSSLSYVLEKAPRAIQELVRVAKKQSILMVGCDSKSVQFGKIHFNQLAQKGYYNMKRPLVQFTLLSVAIAMFTTVSCSPTPIPTPAPADTAPPTATPSPTNTPTPVNFRPIWVHRFSAKVVHSQRWRLGNSC